MSQTAAQYQTPAVFQFESNEVRTVKDEQGNPWWVAKDVCDILGYANHNDAISRVTKGVAKRYPLLTPGGIQELRIINEPDLYRLIAGSRLPAAVRFEKWIFEEVLPAIRKTGSYRSGIDRNQPLSDIEEELVRIRAAVKKHKEAFDIIKTDLEAHSLLRSRGTFETRRAAVAKAMRITGVDFSDLLPQRGPDASEPTTPYHLLADVLNADIRMGKGEPVTVEEALEQDPIPADLNKALQLLGVKVLAGGDLFLVPGKLRVGLLSQTIWRDRDALGILRLFHGSVYRQAKINGTRAWGVSIPAATWNPSRQLENVEEVAI